MFSYMTSLCLSKLSELELSYGVAAVSKGLLYFNLEIFKCFK